MSELQNKTSIELSALFRKVSQEVAKSESGSPEHLFGLASLENISRTMSNRSTTPLYPRLKPPGF
jgi:hypothetical protein